MLKNIDFISIPVLDQKRALEFYTTKLGLTTVSDQPFMDAQRWIELNLGEAQTRVVLFTPDGQQDRIGTFLNMAFTCDDVEKTYEELTARGVEFVSPPRKEKWGMMAIFKDSEGNHILISAK